MAENIMIIRHGEKPSDGDAIRGVDENGKHDDDELSVRGWQRAGALVRFFAPFHNAFAHPALTTPTCLFAPQATHQVESVRSAHTLLPLARYLNRAIDTRFGRDEIPKVAEAATAAAGVVLIAWEHDRIPDIAAAITGTSKICPEHWSDDRFDVVWVLGRETKSEWILTQVPQLVLPGDSSEVIRTKDKGQKSIRTASKVGSAGA